MTIIINDRKWFYGLKADNHDGLLNRYPLEVVDRKLIVAFNPVNFFNKKNGAKKSRLYTLFNSYIDLRAYTKKIDLNEREFHEIILGELPQKPRFDLDCNIEEIDNNDDIDEVVNNLVDDLIKGIIYVLEENGVKIKVDKDILIYSSHGPDKKSFHIIVTNYCHMNNIEAKSFSREVISRVNNKYSKFIDHDVYSSVQGFRIVGCLKIGTNRPKIFHETFKYDGNDITHIYPEKSVKLEQKLNIVVYESLITHISGCTFLPKIGIVHQKITPSEDLSDEMVRMCCDMMRNTMGKNVPFIFVKKVGNIILLNRIRPSICPVCDNKIHEFENPYLIIIHGHLYWDCRRNKNNNRYCLGYIDSTITTKIEHISRTPTLQHNKEAEGMRIKLKSYNKINELSSTKCYTTITQYGSDIINVYGSVKYNENEDLTDPSLLNDVDCSNIQHENNYLTDPSLLDSF
jgi:hypothetical protein